MDIDLRFDPNIHVLVYNEAQWPSQTLAHVYALMEAEHLPPAFWHDGAMPSLNAFIRWYSDPGRVLFFPIWSEEKAEMEFQNIMGMGWVDEIKSHRASAHFWVRQSYRTKLAWRQDIPLRAARTVLSTIFTTAPTLQTLLCHMNVENHKGVGFMKRLGVHMLGEIPRWYYYAGNYYNALVGYILREDVMKEHVVTPYAEQQEHCYAE